MFIRQLSNGLTRIHMHDEDDYEITDDNGVDFWPTKKQIAQIIQKGAP